MNRLFFSADMTTTAFFDQVGNTGMHSYDYSRCSMVGPLPCPGQEDRGVFAQLHDTAVRANHAMMKSFVLICCGGGGLSSASHT